MEYHFPSSSLVMRAFLIINRQHIAVLALEIAVNCLGSKSSQHLKELGLEEGSSGYRGSGCLRASPSGWRFS